MKKKDSLIIIIIIVVLFGWWFYVYNNQNKIQNKILTEGKYNIALINEESASKGGSRNFYSFCYFGNKKIKVRYSYVSDVFYKSHKVGDTILIKFLPDEPEKSMIIEDKEYKSCYGIPPLDGWKELPQCD